jgi:hypothetical protein
LLVLVRRGRSLCLSLFLVEANQPEQCIHLDLNHLRQEQTYGVGKQLSKCQ